MIDQLEELFTHPAAESTQEAFLDAIAGAIEDPARRLRVVAPIRADFYDRPLPFRRFGRLAKDGSVAVVGMSTAELDQAVIGPPAGPAWMSSPSCWPRSWPASPTSRPPCRCCRSC